MECVDLRHLMNANVTMPFLENLLFYLVSFPHGRNEVVFFTKHLFRLNLIGCDLNNFGK